MAPEISQLIADLSATDPRRRIAAADQFTRRADSRAAAIPLVRAAGDPNEQVRELANSALEDLGQPAAEDVPALADLLGDSSAEVAYWAATLLGRCGERAAPAVEALSQTVTTADAPAVRQRAVWALGQIGTAAREALPALRQASVSEDKRLARLAGQVLAKL